MERLHLIFSGQAVRGIPSCLRIDWTSNRSLQAGSDRYRTLSLSFEDVWVVRAWAGVNPSELDGQRHDLAATHERSHIGTILAQPLGCGVPPPIEGNGPTHLLLRWAHPLHA